MRSAHASRDTLAAHALATAHGHSGPLPLNFYVEEEGEEALKGAGGDPEVPEGCSEGVAGREAGVDRVQR
jgi:hypothetical protein